MPKFTRGYYSSLARKLKAPGPCEECGAAGKGEVHHIDKDWSNNDLANLQRLCKSCHAKKHLGEMGRKPRTTPITQKSVVIPNDVMDLYRTRIEASGRSMHAEMIVAIRRHVGLEDQCR